MTIPYANDHIKQKSLFALPGQTEILTLKLRLFKSIK